MKEIVETIAKSLADHPEQVIVEESGDDRGIVFQLHVAPDDMGKAIGRQGSIAKALRTAVKAAATRQYKKVTVEIV